MSCETVLAYLKENGFGGRIRLFDESTATVALAAEALGCAPERIAKTLSFGLGARTILIVAAGDARVDNPRYKAQFGGKATMLTPEQAVERVGHAVGGVCPFCVKPGAEVYLDASLRRFETVFPACGSASSAVELTVPELEKLAAPRGWVDVCKGWQPAQG